MPETTDRAHSQQLEVNPTPLSFDESNTMLQQDEEQAPSWTSQADSAGSDLAMLAGAR